MYNNMNMSNSSANNLFEPYQGFIRGNMFENLYDGYGKVYDIKPMNEQAEMLTYIDIFEFACIDLGLYLDVFPNDQNMIQLYNRFREEKANIMKKYEESYGPLELSSSALRRMPWSWDNNPWPWEG